MLNIAICDDEKIFCDNLHEKLIEYSFVKNNEFNFHIYTDYKDFIRDIEDEIEFDLLFLDIELGDSNGIEIGKYLRDRFNSYKLEIVYVSGNTTYALELFENKPLDFLVKPITYKKVKYVMTLYFRENNKLEHFVTFKFRNSFHTMPKNKIKFIKSDRRLTRIYSSNEEFECYSKLEDFLKLLNDEDFIQIHKSYAVNATYVKKFSRSEVILEGDIRIPVSQQFTKIAKKQYKKFIGARFE